MNDHQGFTRLAPAPAKGGRRMSLGRYPSLVIGVIGLCLIVQLALCGPTLEFAIALMAGSVAAIVSWYSLDRARLQRYPISLLLLFGTCCNTILIPLLYQSATLTKLTENLLLPSQTFQLICITLLWFLLTHIAYAAFPILLGPSEFISRRVLAPIWAFAPVSTFQLWGMGGIGTLATVYWTANAGGSADYGDVSAKLLAGLRPFMVAPFLIPFRHLFRSRNAELDLAQVPLLLGYLGLLILLSFALNTRHLLAIGPFAVALATFYLVLLGRIRFSARATLGGFAGGVLALILLPVLSDFSAAMQMVREVRSTASPTEMVQATIAQFEDKENLQKFIDQEQNASAPDGYSENYLSAYFLQRIQFTKYTDLTLDASSRLSSDAIEIIRDYNYNLVINIIPTNLQKYFGIYLNKTEMELSGGDLYQMLAYNRGYASYLTGSSITTGRDIFGSYFSIYCIVLAIVFYLYYNCFVYRREGSFIISPVIFFYLYEIGTAGLNDESAGSLAARLIREIPQFVIIYAVFYLMLSVAEGYVRAGLRSVVR